MAVPALAVRQAQGGAATSSLTLSMPDGPSGIPASSIAYGGNGGYASTVDGVTPIDGGAGGASVAYLNIESDSYVVVTAQANINSSGSTGAGGGTDIGTGGAGGAASATATALPSSPFFLTVSQAQRKASEALERKPQWVRRRWRRRNRDRFGKCQR